MEKANKTIKDLGKVPELLWDACEVGALNVQNYFNNNKVDPALSPNIMRYAAKKYLKDNLWKIDGLRIKDVPSNGIYLLYKNYRVRVWKYSGPNNGLPSPGHSNTKEGFLRQQSYEQLEIPFSDEVITMDNLVILWETDDNYQLKNLRLSHPRKCNKEDDISADWSIVLEHPVTSKDRLHISLEQVPIYDLPLEFVNDKEQTPVDEFSIDVLPEPEHINNSEPEKEDDINERTDKR